MSIGPRGVLARFFTALAAVTCHRAFAFSRPLDQSNPDSDGRNPTGGCLRTGCPPSWSGTEEKVGERATQRGRDRNDREQADMQVRVGKTVGGMAREIASRANPMATMAH